MLDYIADGFGMWAQLATTASALSALLTIAWIAFTALKRLVRFRRSYLAQDPGKRREWLAMLRLVNRRRE